MKVIFLDIDGVLNVIGQGHDEYGSTFHKHFEENLKYLIEQTGAKIVISSSWRSQGLKRMQDMWAVRNLPGEVIGITCSVSQAAKYAEEQYYDKVERGHEIQEYIDSHPEIERYVILDDDNDMLESQRMNFVRTANNRNHPDCIDIGYGLTKECTLKAINILTPTL